MKKYHFMTGLPRSGSTLLSAILKQNPAFHASITDPLAAMVKGVIETSQNEPGVKHEVSFERRKNIIKGLFDGYYKDVDKPVIFNTNRAWTLLTSQVDAVFPESKFIVCVRDIKWILDSFEVAHRKHPLATSTINDKTIGTVYSRCESLMTTEGVIGLPYIGIKQAITSNEKHKLFLVEYDKLCKNPDTILKGLYAFIGEPFFNHDFNNVEGSWEEYDSEIGISLHSVRKQVLYKPRESIIPPDIVNRYSNMEVWRY